MEKIVTTLVFMFLATSAFASPDSIVCESEDKSVRLLIWTVGSHRVGTFLTLKADVHPIQGTYQLLSEHTSVRRGERFTHMDFLIYEQHSQFLNVRFKEGEFGNILSRPFVQIEESFVWLDCN